MTPARVGTWGAFMDYATPFGVTYATVQRIDENGLVVDVHHLRRELNGEVLWYPLEAPYPRDRKLGFGRMANVCRLLKLREPKWPIEF